jgi:hypothetical protein
LIAYYNASFNKKQQEVDGKRLKNDSLVANALLSHSKRASFPTSKFWEIEEDRRGNLPV